MAMIQTSQMANGLTIASVNMADAHSVSVGVWVKAGARDELIGESGIAHFLEHMAFKGTTKRKAADIAVEIENVGGYMNAYTGREETAYYINLLPENLKMGVEMLSDILAESTLPSDEIERERGVIIQEIGQSVDIADEQVFDCFSTACYGTESFGLSILGSVDSVAGFSRDDLAGFMQRHYGAGQMIICASGALSHDYFSEVVHQYFANIQTAQTPERIAPKWLAGQQLVTRDLEQCHTVFGFQAPDMFSAHRYPMMVLSNLYGGGMSSRLFQQVREQRGLCYSIFSFAQMYSDTGVFGVYAGTSPKDMNEMMKVSAEALKDCCVNLKEEEIIRSKQQLKAAVLMSRDSVSAMMKITATHLTLFGSVIDKDTIIADIEKVTLEDVSALARMVLTTAKPSLSIVGPSVETVDINQLFKL